MSMFCLATWTIEGAVMSKLLVYEPSLIVSPSLAVKIGLIEAIILQQVHYWLERSNHVIDERKWVYNSYNDWQKQFPFLSVMTIKRAFWSLEERGLLISANWNKKKMDKTKWYTIDYQLVEVLFEEPSEDDKSADQIDSSGILNQSSEQNDPSIITDCPEDGFNLNQAIPEITTENTTENKPFVDRVDIVASHQEEIIFANKNILDQTSIFHYGLIHDDDFKYHFRGT